jgi:hypothetical protein
MNWPTDEEERSDIQGSLIASIRKSFVMQTATSIHFHRVISKKEHCKRSPWQGPFGGNCELWKSSSYQASFILGQFVRMDGYIPRAEEPPGVWMDPLQYCENWMWRLDILAHKMENNSIKIDKKKRSGVYTGKYTATLSEA